MIERTDLGWKHEAVISLIDGAVSVSKDSVEYLDGQTPPSDADIDAEITRLKAEHTAQAYARNRVNEYPRIGDQMDMIYKDNLNSTTTHKDAVEVVKTKWPKDNSGPV